jgi:chemotaxis receptor (MCP) glutamine deamidase CheD
MSITGITPIALPLGCIGIIIFDSVLLLTNYLSHVTLPPAYQERNEKNQHRFICNKIFYFSYTRLF